MSDNKFSVDGASVIKETEAAILIEADIFDEPQWIPKSCIDDDSEVFDGGDNSEGTLVVSMWLAEKKGWI